jgi:hypothetical protein
VDASAQDLLRWQFDLTWSLFEYHLERLVSDDLLWEPAALCWTVRPRADGTWVPDWADSEPDPVPMPTIGWLTWHLGWWWTTALAHLEGRTPPDRTEVVWPGDGAATIAWLRGLRDAWSAAVQRLTEVDLGLPAAFPWSADAQLTVAHMVAWVNAELMKNVAEIGQLHLLRHAGDAAPASDA